ncbi:MAG: TM1266 family iron-only hydrogenase system putative regulator [Anaerovoracaceae bacterium]|nr:iron-only hydrogenase system regulator [Bacillota bacterium]MDY2670212.1 TM1266 family iron-only hydrogenase system putative regulator [Anaerovoracaceae bacterium]
METRIAILGIIVEDIEATGQINELLHGCGQYIIGRMGLPYRQAGVNIICIALDAPQDVINTLAGRIGKVRGVSAKTIYSRVTRPDKEE